MHRVYFEKYNPPGALKYAKDLARPTSRCLPPVDWLSMTPAGSPAVYGKLLAFLNSFRLTITALPRCHTPTTKCRLPIRKQTPPYHWVVNLLVA